MKSEVKRGRGWDEGHGEVVAMKAWGIWKEGELGRYSDGGQLKEGGDRIG